MCAQAPRGFKGHSKAPGGFEGLQKGSISSVLYTHTCPYFGLFPTGIRGCFAKPLEALRRFTKPLYTGHFAKPLGASYTRTYAHFRPVPYISEDASQTPNEERGLCTDVHSHISLFCYVFLTDVRGAPQRPRRGGFRKFLYREASQSPLML